MPEVEEHLQMFRRRAFALPAKHEMKPEPEAEWRLVRPPAPAWAIVMLALLFVSGCAWAVKERYWIGFGALVMAVMGLVLIRRNEMRVRPAVEVIAKLSDDGLKMTFPLAGIEQTLTSECQLALRDVFLKRSSYSGLSGPWDIAAASGFNDNGKLWSCVYVFGEGEWTLVFAQPWDFGNTGMKKAVRAFCDEAGVPLMEPDLKQHGPSVISI